MAEMWKAHFWRLRSERWQEFPTAKAAFDFLEEGEHDSYLATVGIVKPDGVEVFYPDRNHEECRAEWVAMGLGEEPDPIDLFMSDGDDFGPGADGS